MPDVTRRLNQLPDNDRDRVRDMMKNISKQTLEGIDLSDVLQILVQDYEYDLKLGDTGPTGRDEG